MTNHITIDGVVYTEADLEAMIATAERLGHKAPARWVAAALIEIQKRTAAKHAA